MNMGTQIKATPTSFVCILVELLDYMVIFLFF